MPRISASAGKRFHNGLLLNEFLFNSLGECAIEGPEHASYGSVHVQYTEEARLR